MSVTWIDEETIVYISLSEGDHNLYEYNYVDKKETCTDIWDGSINGISPDNKTLYCSTGDKDSFEILRAKICSVNIDSWTTNDVYIFYGNQQIFGIDDVTKGILCKDYSDEKKKLYFTQCEKWKYKKRLPLDLEHVDNIVWPVSEL